jgi:hypothetical protein
VDLVKAIFDGIHNPRNLSLSNLLIRPSKQTTPLSKKARRFINQPHKINISQCLIEIPSLFHPRDIGV